MSYKVKKVIKAIVLVMVGALLGGFLLSATGTDIKNPFGREVNPDNLIKVEDYLSNSLQDTAGGLKVRKNDDGSFVLSGKHAEEDESENAIYKSDRFVNVQLEGGETYVLSVGNKNADTEKFGLYYVLNGETVLLGGDMDAKIKPVEDTVISIGYFVKNNTFFFGLGTKITPILVVDGDPVEFYK